MTDTWENDNWENDVDNIPDLLSIQENKQKKLMELHQMEKVESELIDDLFGGNGVSKDTDAKGCYIKSCKSKKYCCKRNETIEYKQKIEAKKIEQEYKLKQNKLNENEKLRREEMYGEATIDKYEDKYGYIEDEY